MDINEIRRTNLRRLSRRSKNSAAFARRIGVSHSYLGQIIGPNPRKNIGSTKAREIEHLLQLPAAYLDVQHEIEGFDADLFIAAVKLSEEIINRERARMEPEKRARFYLQVYKMVSAANADPKIVRELLLLAL